MKRETHAPRCQHRNAQAGFSMIELLIAMSVTIFGLLGLISMHKSTMQGNQGANRLVEATTIAQRTMEELRGIPVQSDDPTVKTLITEYPAWPVVKEPLLPHIQGRDSTEYRRFVSIHEMTDISPDLVMIRVEVVWADNGADPATAAPQLVHETAFEIIRTRQEGQEGEDEL